MFYQLPPVGNTIRLLSADQPESLLQSVFSPYKPCYFASGTAALAAAIGAAIKLKRDNHPEVILPAYGCPDLVSAVVFAGAKPVLVDLETDRPWIDLEQLLAHISSRTVAIVAVNLFGISERIDQIRLMAEQVGAVLIEDSAQAFPGGKDMHFWGGDLVVLSFGRGKPVSLLGGGAVLYRDSALGDLLPESAEQLNSGKGRWVSLWLKAALYNRFISPRLYWIPERLPFLHLGKTRYLPLQAVDAMDSVRLAILPANVYAYQGDNMGVQIALAEILDELDPVSGNIIDLPRMCQVKTDRRLLRYPLLVDAAVRRRLYLELKRHGLGPSGMYPVVLPAITGLPAGQGLFPEAEAFAARILTLPTHKSVRRSDIEKIRMVLGSQ